MKAKVQVLSVESRKGKDDRVWHTACCLDMESGQNRMKNTFDFGLSALDIEHYPEPATMLENEIIEIGIIDIRAGFGGRMEMRGSILTAPKKTAK